MTNELFRTLFMAAVLMLITVSTYSAWQLTKVNESLDEIKPQIEYCVWHHPASKMYAAHTTSVMKHTEMAKKMARRFGRPSDEGGCR